MKALALDTSISCIQIAAKNDDKIASLVLDIGMRQSEKLLPSIDFVLKQAELEPGDLDYTALCQGPGSFTGLRLAFAALKDSPLRNKQLGLFFAAFHGLISRRSPGNRRA